MSGRIKTKTIVKALGNKDIQDIFQSSVGGDTVNLHIAHPKYEKMREHAGRFVTLLETLKDSEVMRIAFPEERGALAAFVESLHKKLAASFDAPDLEEFIDKKAMDEYGRIPDEVADKYRVSFEASKKSEVVTRIITVCDKLSTYKAHIKDPNDLKDKFLSTPPLTLVLFEEVKIFDLKKMYINTKLSPTDKKLLLIFIHKMYAISHDLYEVLRTPDIDIGEFVGIVRESVGGLRSKFPRCKEALHKIEESMGTLSSNFDGYYQDYVISSNPATIMEGFVLDVSKSTTGTNPRLAQQFREIIRHYRKTASENANDPKFQAVFHHFDENYKSIAKKDKKNNGDDEDEEDDESHDSASSPQSKVADAKSPAADSPADKKAPSDEKVPAKSKSSKRNKRRRIKKKAGSAAVSPTDGDEEESGNPLAEEMSMSSEFTESDSSSPSLSSLPPLPSPAKS